MKTQDISNNLGNGDILIYQSEDGRTHIDVRMEQETVWLTQQQLCELYQTSKSNVSEHIKHIFEDGELDENVVVRKFRTTTQHRVTCRKFRQVQQHPIARRRSILGDYQISRTPNEEVQITHARCSDMVRAGRVK